KRNKDNYILILTSDFEFILDDNDALALGLEKPYSWDKASETEMMENLHSHLSSLDSNLDVMLSILTSSNSGPNEVEVNVDYYIMRTNAPEGESTEFRGEATLILEEDSGYWYLKKWYDNRKNGITNPTWGMLKYEFVQ
ncbi:MAG: hypothetical protein JXR56_05700, partial [Candidatus Cloacimonetes bacterium]|nr:hypothetical protein [Candidatus Cloacimonadota bacterium]